MINGHYEKLNYDWQTNYDWQKLAQNYDFGGVTNVESSVALQKLISKYFFLILLTLIICCKSNKLTKLFYDHT